ncbi:M48 family metalloprotease [Mycolicibacterium sp. J2]|uniref:M48 family metalloprotease n=1 Tax=Mycolicibacterium sp. J2 TaxID=2993511 RepID=UPI00224B1276|nr:M48 family metalloprotease [Mycolicibacterium sp. J2]MCX2716075.1 M48 family metalloprotease [Mycolicibacterium sp. J2]
MSVGILLSVPWLVAAVLTWQLPRLISRFHPDWLVPVLAWLAAIVSVSSWISLAAGATVLSNQRDIACRAVGSVLAVAAAAGVFSAVLHARNVWVSVRVNRAFRGRSGDEAGVLILDDDRPDAFAVPGRGGGLIVLTTALAGALTADERRAVIDHERAHLRRHHHLHVQAVELATRINPMLRPWCHVVRLAAERCADEYAARRDRRTAAQAVARAALLCARVVRPGVCHITGRPSDARVRVVALVGAPPARQCRRAVLAAAVVAVVLSGQSYLAADVIQDRLAPEVGETPSTVIG